MKTLRELNEGLSDIVKDKDIISYMDTSLSDDVMIKIDDKIYKIEGFGNQAAANIKNTSKEKIFVIDKDSLLKLDKKEFKRLLIEPNSGDFKGIISINGAEDKEIIFNVSKDVDESIIIEKGSDVVGIGITGALGFLIGGPLGAAVSAALFGILNPNAVSALFSGIAGLGIFKKLFNKEGNKNIKNDDDQPQKASKNTMSNDDNDDNDNDDNDNDDNDNQPNKTSSEADTSKTNIKTLCMLNMYAEDLGDPKISESINKLTNLVVTDDGNINNEILQKELSKEENKNLIKQIEDIAKKSDKEMISFIDDSNKLSDASVNKYIEIVKTKKDYNDLETKYNDKKETIASLEENIKVFKEQGDDDSVKNAEDKIKSLNKELKSLEESLNSHSKKIENLNNDIRKETKSLAISKLPKTNNKNTENTKDTKNTENTKDTSGEDDDDEEIPLIKDDGTKDENKTYNKKVADDGSIKYTMKSGDEETDISKDEFEKNKENAIKVGGYKDDREDDSNGDDEKDDDLDADDNDTDAEEIIDKDGNKKRVIKNPARVWHRKKKKNGKGITKSYYNSKGDSISSDEFKNKMSAFKEKKAKKANSTTAGDSESKNESIVRRLRTLREMRLK